MRYPRASAKNSIHSLLCPFLTDIPTKIPWLPLPNVPHRCAQTPLPPLRFVRLYLSPMWYFQYFYKYILTIHRCQACDAPIAKLRGKKFGLSQAKTVTSAIHLVHDKLKVLCCTSIMGMKIVCSQMRPCCLVMIWFLHSITSSNHMETPESREWIRHVQTHGRPANILEIDTSPLFGTG